jgi:hypothetical protein
VIRSNRHPRNGNENEIGIVGKTPSDSLERRCAVTVPSPRCLIKVRIQATQTTAAIAGLWSALGLVPMDAWLTPHQSSLGLWSDVLFLGAVTVFLFIPFYFLVIGRESRFRRTWILEPDERARYWEFGKRAFVWLVSTAACGTLWGAILYFAFPALWIGR